MSVGKIFVIIDIVIGVSTIIVVIMVIASHHRHRYLHHRHRHLVILFSVAILAQVLIQWRHLHHSLSLSMRASERSRSPLRLDVDVHTDNDDFDEVAALPLDLATVWAELHEWPRNVFKRLGGFHGATVEQLVGAFLSMTVNITTNFSGMGTPEVALHMLRLWALSLGINDPCGIFIAYSASDWDDLCREMLSAYGHGIGPLHLFGDLMDVLPREWVGAWTIQLKFLRQKISGMVSKVPPDRRKAMRASLVEKYGEHFLKSALSKMKSRLFDVNAMFWCFKHNRLCRRYTAALAGGLLLEIAGSPCVGFSTICALWGFRDTSCLAFLAWIYIMRSVRRHIIIHECTSVQMGVHIRSLTCS